jgi:signal peptidase I
MLLVAIACAAAAGFVGGRAVERSAASTLLPAVPGMRDYTALAFYNHYSIVRANGPSMQPALAQYNFLLVRDTKDVKRGDILVSRHHGIHRVLGLPGETLSLEGGRVRICSPRHGTPPGCRYIADPTVKYRNPQQHHDEGPMQLKNGYGTVPDNRSCCEYLIFVPANDVVGVVAGSLLSYGQLSPPGQVAPSRPLTSTLVYDAPPAASPPQR